MNEKNQWKVLLGVFVFLLYIGFLESYGFSFIRLVLIAVIAFLLLILWMPPAFIEMFRKFGTENKHPDQKWGMTERVIRVLTILVINTIHDTFWQFITKYYPFSLLHRDRLIHAKNSFLRKFILEIEEYAKSKQVPFIIQSAEVYSGFSRFSATRTGGKGNKDTFLTTVQKKLEAKYKTVYITPENKGFTIKIPTNIIRSPR